MSLTNVWVQTQADGLIRADQVAGIDAHQTPAVPGKPSRWLLVIVLTTPVGSGTREGWNVTALHRTLVQTAFSPEAASVALARLLAQLDATSAAGIVQVEQEDRDTTRGDTTRGPEDERLSIGSGGIRFRFVPFPGPAPGHHTDAEYL